MYDADHARHEDAPVAPSRREEIMQRFTANRHLRVDRVIGEAAFLHVYLTHLATASRSRAEFVPLGDDTYMLSGVRVV